jgi:TPR repeat protein
LASEGRIENARGSQTAGDVIMARHEVASEMAGFGAGTPAADLFFELGMQKSTGRDGGVDLVAAHKWFNIAAAKGSAEAARMRGEVAAEMSAAQIAEAQKAARAYLALH